MTSIGMTSQCILFSGFRGEVENVKVCAERRTNDDIRRAMAIAHLSLRLR